MTGVDPALVHVWLRGWCLARHLPPPVAMGDHWRVEVGLPDQKARHVFPAASPQLAELAQTIREPFVYLKALMPRERLAEYLPPGWRLDPPRFMMIRDSLDSTVPQLPPSYRLALAPDDTPPSARIFAADGAIAASGQVVRVGDHAVYNVIQTDPAHRRRGLGSAVMRALDDIARDGGARHGVLMATEEGRALYESLGWHVCSPYASAVIPDVAAGGIER